MTTIVTLGILFIIALCLVIYWELQSDREIKKIKDRYPVSSRTYHPEVDRLLEVDWDETESFYHN